ncbi:hypothetical protein CFC21_072502 [Triticum aestivum]|uniref:Uncharacterized protein n=2 Tax=Triticum aestivum TaxID=4565 RepID=A0A9R1HJE5_WHEAT|nr:hypothetical protein CFC21_072502 [Triticum aestivum]
MCKSKTSILAARLLIQASLRRSSATIGAFSHRIHILSAAADRKKSAMMECHKTLVMRNVEKTLVMHCLIKRMMCDVDGEVEGNEDDDDVLLDVCDEDDNDEPPVMDVIRNNREAEGLEFNIENEIDQAADMFITRFRKRMNQSF